MSSQRNNGNKHSKGTVNGYLSKSHSTGSQLGSQRLSGGLVSLGATKRTRSTGLGSTGKLAVPKPVNLPSLKKEHSGNDPTTQIVPSGGGGGWNKPEEQPAANHSDSRQTSLTAGSTWGSAFHRASPAPWESADKHGLGDREQYHRADRHLNPADYPTLEAAVKAAHQSQPRLNSVTPTGSLSQGGNKWEDDERVPVGGTARAFSADWSERFEEDERSVFRREPSAGRPGWDDPPRERYGRDWRGPDDGQARPHRDRDGYVGRGEELDGYWGRDIGSDRGSAGPPSRNSNYDSAPRSVAPGRRDTVSGRDSRGYGYDRYGDRYRASYEPEPRFVDDPTLFPPPPPPRASGPLRQQETRVKESFRDPEREAFDAELDRVAAGLEKEKTRWKEEVEPSPEPSEHEELVPSEHEEEVEVPAEELQDEQDKEEGPAAQEFGKLKAAESLQAVLEAQEEEERKRKAAALEKLRELEARIAARAAEQERSQGKPGEAEETHTDQPSPGFQESTNDVDAFEDRKEASALHRSVSEDDLVEHKVEQDPDDLHSGSEVDATRIDEDVLSLESSNVCVIGDGETVRSIITDSVLTDFNDEEDVEDEAGEAVVSQLLNDTDEEQPTVVEQPSQWNSPLQLPNGTQSAWQSGPPANLAEPQHPELFGTGSAAFGPALMPTAAAASAIPLQPPVTHAVEPEPVEAANTSPPSWRRVVQGAAPDPPASQPVVSTQQQDFSEPSSRSSSRGGKGRGKGRNAKEPTGNGRGRGRGRTGRGGRDARSNLRDASAHKQNASDRTDADSMEHSESSEVSAEPGFIEVRSKKQLRGKNEAQPARDATYKGKPKGKAPVSRPQGAVATASKLPTPVPAPPVAAPSPAAADVVLGDAPVSSPYAFGTNLAEEVASIAKLQLDNSRSTPAAARNTSNVLTSLDPVACPPPPPSQAESKLEHVKSPSLDRQVGRPDTVDVLGVLPADLYLDTPQPPAAQAPASNPGLTFGYAPPAQGMQGLVHAPFPNMLFSSGPASMWQQNPHPQAQRPNVPPVDSFYAAGPPTFPSTTFGTVNTNVLGDNRSILSGPPLMFGQIGQFGKPNSFAASSMQGPPPLQFGQLGTAFGQPFVQTNKQPDWSMVPNQIPVNSQAKTRSSYAMSGAMEPMMPMSFPPHTPPEGVMQGYPVGSMHGSAAPQQPGHLNPGPPMGPVQQRAAPGKVVDGVPSSQTVSAMPAQSGPRASSMAPTLPDEVFLNDADGNRVPNGQLKKDGNGRRQAQGGQAQAQGRHNNGSNSRSGGRASRSRRVEQEPRPASHASGPSNAKASNGGNQRGRGRTQPMKTIYVPKAEGVGAGRNGPDATAAA